MFPYLCPCCINKINGGAYDAPVRKKLNIPEDLRLFLEQQQRGLAAHIKGEKIPEERPIKVTSYKEIEPPEAPPFAPPFDNSIRLPSYQTPIIQQYEPRSRLIELQNLKAEIEESKSICKLLKEKRKKHEQMIMNDIDLGINDDKKIQDLLLLENEIKTYSGICRLLRRDYNRKKK